VIDCVVAPVDHKYELPSDAVSVTFPFAQNVVAPPAVIVGFDMMWTMTAAGAEVALQPLALVTVTLYSPAVLTSIDCVVAPVDHKYAAAGFAVSVTWPPWQKVVGPLGVIVAVAAGYTATAVAAEVALQPLAFVTVTL
jgi:hypothetical protein